MDENILNKFLKESLLVEISNLSEALIAEKAGIDGIILIRTNFSINNDNNYIKYSYNIDEILNIKEKIKIPLIVKCDIGNFMYAKILESFNINYIYETSTNNNYNIIDHIQKKNFNIPFICSAHNFNEALLRINEGCYILNIESDNNDYYKSLNILKDIISKINNILFDYNNGIDIGVTEYYTNNYEIDETIISNIITHKKLPCLIYLSGNILTPLDIIFILNTQVDGIIISNDIFKFENSYQILSLNKLAFSNYDNIEKIKEIIKIADPIISKELKNLSNIKNNASYNISLQNNDDDFVMKYNELQFKYNNLQVNYDNLQMKFIKFEEDNENEKIELENNIINIVNLIKNNLN